MFPLGIVVVTLGASEALAEANTLGLTLLGRHVNGDWGQLDEDLKERNDEAVATCDRIISMYPLNTGETVLIVTEGDRNTIVILLPEEWWERGKGA